MNIRSVEVKGQEKGGTRAMHAYENTHFYNII